MGGGGTAGVDFSIFDFHQTSIQIIVLRLIPRNIKNNFLAVVVYGSIIIECIKIEIFLIDSARNFSLLHPGWIAHNSQSGLGLVGWAVKKTSSIVAAFVGVAGSSLGMILTGGQKGSAILISKICASLLHWHIKATDDQTIHVVVFLFKIQYFFVGSCKPIVVTFMAATITTVVEPVAGQAVDGIRSDHKLHSIGMIMPASIIGQLCSFNTDLVPGHDSPRRVRIGNGILNSCCRIRYRISDIQLLIGNITALTHDLINELYDLCSGCDWPGHGIVVDTIRIGF